MRIYLYLGFGIAGIVGIALFLSARLRSGIFSLFGGAGDMLAVIGDGGKAVADAIEAGSDVVADTGSSVIDIYQNLTGTQQTATTPEGRLVSGWTEFMYPHTHTDIQLLESKLVKMTATEADWHRMNLYLMRIQENIAIRGKSGMTDLDEMTVRNWLNWKEHYAKNGINPNT